MAEKVDEHFPESYFTNMMIEKANIIKNHLHKSVHPLIIVGNIEKLWLYSSFMTQRKEMILLNCA